ncbi:MAG TPA: phosphotransferase, partial [Porphyromonadaceae bacterium]|nr:phosphotransferase [Porphyromonadaceae bacterium]
KMMQRLIELFTKHSGKSSPKIEALPSSGSNRRYYRLTQDDVSIIGVQGQSLPENRAFISLSDHFKKQGLNVPQVFATSADGLLYIQEDLGDGILFNAINAGRLTGVFSNEEKELLHKTISMLADFQV